ncbi:MAG: ROK family protein [Halobacteriaceae archaeon]
MTATLVGGVDLGATNLRAAVATSDGTIREQVQERTPRDDRRAVEAAVVAALGDACQAAGVSPDRLAAVGVGTVGPLDRDAGVVRDPPNLPGVSRIDLEGPLSERTGAPVVVHNDAIAGLLAERAHGAPPNAVYLTLSTGIGAGACVDGHVLTGRDGNAAEVGHFVVAPEGELRCGCGAAGHWEAYAAGARIPDHAREVAAGTALETDLSLETLTTPALVEAARAGDPLASETLDRVAAVNAIGLANIVHAYDPAAITIGGTVAREAGDQVLEPALEALPEHLLVPAPDVRVTSLETPVLEGALAAASDRLPA